MRLFLVARHGQSLFNVDKAVNGDPTLDRGLSEQGIEEAERLAGQLAALPVDLVGVSPFPRALQTANIALAGRDVPHLVDEQLPGVAAQGRARSADAFCEQGVFTADQCRRVLEAAAGYGMRIRVHADELAPSGGAEGRVVVAQAAVWAWLKLIAKRRASSSTCV